MLCGDSCAPSFGGGLSISMYVILPTVSNDHQDNKKLTSVFAAESSVSLLGIALVFDLLVSWLAHEGVEELCWCTGVLDLSFPPSPAQGLVSL